MEQLKNFKPFLSLVVAELDVVVEVVVVVVVGAKVVVVGCSVVDKELVVVVEVVDNFEVNSARNQK